MVKVTLQNQNVTDDNQRYIEVDAPHAITVCLDPDTEGQSNITMMGELTVKGLVCQLGALIRVLGTPGYLEYGVIADMIYLELLNLLPVYVQNASSPHVQEAMIDELIALTTDLTQQYSKKPSIILRGV